MTNELAIRILISDVLGTLEQTQEAVTMAVKALLQSDATDKNVGDTIYRQSAIDVLNKLDVSDGVGISSIACDLQEEAIHSIESLPPAQSEQLWIPCSEETGDGYPEKDGFYYVTEQNYGFYFDADYKQRVTHTSHFKNGDFTDRFYTENSSNITAWMPLPDPYKGEQG